MAITIAQWALLNSRDNDPAIGIIEEASLVTPEIDVLNFRPIVGTSFKYLRRDTFARGSFRTLNTGVAPSSNNATQVSCETYFYDSLITVDEAQVLGDMGILGDLMTNEAIGLQSGNFQNLANQIYYGVNTSDGGFDGLNTIMNSAMTVTADTSGTTSSPLTNFTGVYFVHTNTRGVSLVGGNQTALELGEVYQKDVEDSSGKSYRAYAQRMRSWLGMQLGHSKSVAKIEKVTSELTQEMMAETLALFPTDMRPNAIFMNRATFYNLWVKEKANAVDVTGDDVSVSVKQDYNYAKFMSFMDIPIHITDAIKSNEYVAA